MILFGSTNGIFRHITRPRMRLLLVQDIQTILSKNPLSGSLTVKTRMVHGVIKSPLRKKQPIACSRFAYGSVVVEKYPTVPCKAPETG